MPKILLYQNDEGPALATQSFLLLSSILQKQLEVDVQLKDISLAVE